MERNANNEENTVEVTASEFIAKYKDKKSRELYCFEKNWYVPNEIGFDATFFLQVIAGKKKYLPANFAVQTKLGYFRKGETLSKDYILEKMQGNEAYGYYVPDGCKPKKLSRDFLLTLIAYIDPQLYKALYATYKEQVIKRQYNKWADFKITVANENAQDLKDFVPVDSRNSSHGGFRLTKNHVSTNVFRQFQNLNQPHQNNAQQNITIQRQQQQINELIQQHNQSQNIIEQLNQQIRNQDAPNEQAVEDFQAMREAYNRLEEQFANQRNTVLELQNKNSSYEQEKRNLIAQIQQSNEKAAQLDKFIKANINKLDLGNSKNDDIEMNNSPSKSSRTEKKAKLKK